MLSVKSENAPVLDVILRHLQAHGNTDQEQPSQSAGANLSNGCNGTTSSRLAENSVDQKRPTDDDNRFQVVFEEMANGLIVPCILDVVLNEKLIPVKVANSKICSVYPNAQQNSEAHSELRKPLCTRSIKSDSLLEMYNYVLRFHCANEYGLDFSLEGSDRFVIFDDFANYYACVRKAFPNVSSHTTHRVNEDEVLPIQGGFLSLGKIICPYILRSNIALLPLQIVKVAGFGTITHSFIKECFACMNGWLASPRELAFLTDKCQKHNLPLVFGRDTRLVPLPQLRSLFKNKPGCEILNFPEKDDASDQQHVTPAAPASQKQRQQLFSGGTSVIHHTAATSVSSVRPHASVLIPNAPSVSSVSAQSLQNAVGSGPVNTRSSSEVPLMPWNLQQISNLPQAALDASHKQQKRRRIEKRNTNNQNSCTAAV